MQRQRMQNKKKAKFEGQIFSKFLKKRSLTGLTLSCGGKNENCIKKPFFLTHYFLRLSFYYLFLTTGDFKVKQLSFRLNNRFQMSAKQVFHPQSILYNTKIRSNQCPKL